MRFFKYLTLFFVLLNVEPAMAKDRSFALSLPLVAMNNESKASGEFNLGSIGALSVEILSMMSHDAFFGDEKDARPNDELIMSGAEVALFYSSYSDAKEMSGFHWGVGVGYRALKAEWARTPDGSFTLAEDAPRDNLGRINHDLRANGMAAHARVGYRFVGDSVPIVLGAFIGARHYQNQFDDRDNPEAVATPEKDREALQRRFMSAIEPGLELGFSF